MMRMLVVIVLVLLPVIQADAQTPATAYIEQGAKNWQEWNPINPNRV